MPMTMYRMASTTAPTLDPIRLRRAVRRVHLLLIEPGQCWSAGRLPPTRSAGVAMPAVLCRTAIMGRFGAESHRPSRTEDYPTHRWEQTRWWGSKPSASSLAPGSAPATRQVGSAKRLGPASKCLYRIGLCLIGPDEMAARPLGCLRRWRGNRRATHRFGSPRK